MASPQKKSFLLRLDPALHEALQRWANDDFRSLNAHIEFLLCEATRRAGRKVKAGTCATPLPQDGDGGDERQGQD